MEENYVLWLDDMHRNLIYGFGSALILVGVVHMERQGNLKAPDIFVLLGNASYVIYLINFTALSFLAKISVYMGARELLPASFTYILLSVVSVFIGVLVHIGIEKPFMRFLRKQPHVPKPIPPIAAPIYETM